MVKWVFPFIMTSSDTGSGVAIQQGIEQNESYVHSGSFYLEESRHSALLWATFCRPGETTTLLSRSFQQTPVITV